jgi:hypothetical protein
VLKNNVIDMSVTKGIYKDILSIKISYVLYGELSNYEDVITINIDLKNNKVLSNDDIYNMIVNDVNNDDSINNILKNKVIDKSNVYRSDISDYIYDLDVNLISDL